MLIASVAAGTIVGTKRSEVLRGTAKADTISGKAGGDTIYGLGGNDTLNGGLGNDTLVGGKGRDRYNCGPGYDTVRGDAQDIRPGDDCEDVRGLPAPTPPPEKPQCSDGIDNDGDNVADYPADRGCSSPDDNDETDPPPAQAGHYEGKTSQNELFAFDVQPDGFSLTNLHTGQTNESCTPSLYIYGGYNDFGSYVIHISPSGSFAVTATGTGTVGETAPSTYTLKITGQFNGASASGTIVKTLSFDLQGTHYNCSSGDQTWSATRAS